jgi:hypothetical protein
MQQGPSRYAREGPCRWSWPTWSAEPRSPTPGCWPLADRELRCRSRCLRGAVTTAGSCDLRSVGPGPAAVRRRPPTLEGDQQATGCDRVAEPSASCRRTAPGHRSASSTTGSLSAARRAARGHTDSGDVLGRPASGFPRRLVDLGLAPMPNRCAAVHRTRATAPGWSRRGLLRPASGCPSAGRAHPRRPVVRGRPRSPDPPEFPPRSTTVPGGVRDFYSPTSRPRKGSGELFCVAKPVGRQRVLRPSTACGQACGQGVKNPGVAGDNVCAVADGPVHKVWIDADGDDHPPDGEHTKSWSAATAVQDGSRAPSRPIVRRRAVRPVSIKVAPGGGSGRPLG